MQKLRHHAWWSIPTLVVAAVLGWAIGYPYAWLAYAVFNIAGVWLYCEVARSPTRRTLMKVLAIPMVPVGVVGVLATGGGRMGPRESSSFGSSDEDTRSESARAAGLFNRGTI